MRNKQQTTPWKKLSTLITALVCMTAGALVAAAPANAAASGLLDVTCVPPSSGTTTYTPPLTSTSQVVTSTQQWQFGPCVSTSVPALTSGTVSAVGAPRARSCLELLDSGSATRTIVWNTGQTSTISFNYTTSVAGAVLLFTVTGTVTSGLFAGDSVVATQTGPATDILLCTLGLGQVSSIYGLFTLEITSL
ncbi:hypothetical protein ACVV2G_18715 [Streptomyces ziwulingensis]